MSRWQRQFFRQPSGLCELSFRFNNVTLRFVQIGRRFQYSRQVGFHIVTSVVVEGGVEVLLGTLEVAQLRVSLTKSLCDECSGIIVAYRIGVRQGTLYVVECPGVSAQESSNGESGVYHVRHLFSTL